MIKVKCIIVDSYSYTNNDNQTYAYGKRNSNSANIESEQGCKELDYNINNIININIH